MLVDKRDRGSNPASPRAQAATNRSRGVRGQKCPPIIGWHHVTPLMPPPTTTSMSSTQGVVLLLEHSFRIHVVEPVSALLAGLLPGRAAYFNGADIVVQYVDPAECGEAGVAITAASSARDAFPASASQTPPSASMICLVSRPHRG